MTTFVNAMKNEKMQLAQKEVHIETEGLKAASLLYLKQMAGLKRGVAEFKKAVGRLE